MPKVRWMAVIVVMAYALRLAGVPAEWQATIAAGCLTVAKLLQEFANQIDIDDPYVHTMGRSAVYKLDGKRQPGFWRRVL